LWFLTCSDSLCVFGESRELLTTSTERLIGRFLGSPRCQGRCRILTKDLKQPALILAERCAAKYH
jgi:hypothetical protein